MICTGIIGLFIDHFVRTLKRQIVTFSILRLLLLQACREKMSLSYLVNKFIEKCTIENKIVTGLKKDIDFFISVYYLELFVHGH